MPKKFLLIISIFLIIIILSSLRFLSRSSIDFDEGVYWTSFLLVSKGYHLYNLIFFSQPPGFFFLTYPIFFIFGQSLESARFSIFLWSIVGLFGIIWITYELKVLKAAFLTLAILYFLPRYYTETLTFHADYLTLVFCTLSVASILRFKNTLQSVWLVISGFCLSLSLLTKLNIIPFFPVLAQIYILIKAKKPHFKFIPVIILEAFSIFFMAAFIYILPFNLKSIYNDVILLRLKAAAFFQNENRFFEYLNNDGALSLLLFLTLVLMLILRFQVKRVGILLIWLVINFVFLYFYRPLEPHHLLFLTVPASLIFSILFIVNLSRYTTPKIVNYFSLILLGLSALNFFYISFNTPQKITSPDQDKMIKFIENNTKINDLVVSDDSLLNAATKRLPPPELVDLSHVRIDSGQLTDAEFDNIIAIYKPKLIMLVNGRLIKLPHLKEILEKNNYNLSPLSTQGYSVYIR